MHSALTKVGLKCIAELIKFYKLIVTYKVKGCVNM